MSPVVVCVRLRSCWVCFATDEDDRTAEWVRPCRCRGSTKWVHQACLQRWVDEKQRGNSTARVACPQCNAEYLIVFPKLGRPHFRKSYTCADEGGRPPKGLLFCQCSASTGGELPAVIGKIFSFLCIFFYFGVIW